MHRFNISALTNRSYIEYLKVLNANEVDGFIHITYQFYERTNPGSSGGGMCGAGLELNLGYLRLHKDWRLAASAFRIIDSCCCTGRVEAYGVEPGRPELGLIQID